MAEQTGPVAGLTDFEVQYFMQTRREIDVEKQERDKLLNFCVLLLAAFLFASVQHSLSAQIAQSGRSLFVSAPVLVLISSLFWVRWKKLGQIADRWRVLHAFLVRRVGEDETRGYLEGRVISDLGGFRYVVKDFWLNIAVSLPVYGVMLWGGQLTPACPRWAGMARTISVILVHLVCSSMLLARRHRPRAA